MIVIGASAGGVEALQTLMRELPADLPAAVFIVLHMPAQGPGLLPQILNRAAQLHVVAATDGATIEHGTVYVAVPDHHLLIKDGRVQVNRGPRENRHRPAVDALFRTAVYGYGARVIGVVLSGALDDGTAGLLAIKQRGGRALVQEPREALYPSMPQSAIDNGAADQILPLKALAQRLVELVYTPVAEEALTAASEQMQHEVEIMELDQYLLTHPDRIGPPSEFSCPECGGVLHEVKNKDMVRFRCRVGHAFSAESMMAEQSEALEAALWAALNTLEESVSLARRMAQQAQENGRARLTTRFQQKAQDAQQRALVIRQVLLKEETKRASDPSSAVAGDAAD